MTGATHVLDAVLLHSIWEDTAIAIALFAALGILRRHAPAARYAISCIALVFMVCLPILTAPMLDGLPSNSQGATPEAPILRLAVERSTTATRDVVVKNPSNPPSNHWMSSVRQWALPAWFAGVLLLSLRLVFGAVQTVTLTYRATPADRTIRATVDRLCARLGITRRIDVLSAVALDGPAAFGWIRPVILVPPAVLMGLSPQQLEAILAHELAHIRRHDAFVNVVQLVVETLFFYHPAIWWASHRIRVERELCCDDIAVKSTGNALEYARALRIVAQVSRYGPPMAIGATDGPFVYRIRRLLGLTSHEQRFSWAAVLTVGLVLAAGALDLGWMRLAAQPGTASAHIAPEMVFEVASIKTTTPSRGPAGCRGTDSQLQGARTVFQPRVNAPSELVPLGRCVITAARLNTLMAIAFDVPPQRISGLPEWQGANQFHVEATAMDPASATEQQLLAMLQHFITDEFRLTVHRERKEIPGYALVVPRDGPKSMHPSHESQESSIPQGTTLVFTGYSMPSLAAFLSSLPPIQRPVADLTAINGRFDFVLDFSRSTPKDLGAGDLSRVPADARRLMESKMAMAGWETIFSDVQQQLGLRLEASTVAVDSLIVDHAELPRTMTARNVTFGE